MSAFREDSGPTRLVRVAWGSVEGGPAHPPASGRRPSVIPRNGVALRREALVPRSP
ncbi:hypothetical protein MICRO80W_810013 [Micrococcus luteus]|nr:hypothetical protein MICRO80W_810013 [Micrococcus luteus]